MYVAERHFKNEEPVQKLIMAGYRAGLCDHNGNTIPPEKRGMAGKGSHFSRNLVTSDLYRRNYDRIFRRKKNNA